MENGDKGCPQGKGIEEKALHAAICRGLTKSIPDTEAVKSLVRTMLAYAGSENELLLEYQTVEASIRDLQSRDNEAEELCIRTEGNKEPYMEQIRKCYAAISEYRKRASQIKEQLESNEDFQAELHRINNWLDGETVSFSQYDDEIVRYLVDSIRVTAEMELIIHLKGGISIRETVCV